MAPIDFVLCMTALIIGVVAQRVLLALERNERWRRRKMARLPVTRIADVRSGVRVKVRGHVRPLDGALTAPLGGGRALAWLLSLRHTAGGRRRTTQLERACDFRLCDDSGEAIVRANQAAIVCALPAGVPLTSAPPSLSPLLEHAGVERRWLGTRWTPEAAEAVIAPDSVVTVVGVARRDGDTLVISHDEAAPLYLAA
jgi:hypothetical protein